MGRVSPRGGSCCRSRIGVLIETEEGVKPSTESAFLHDLRSLAWMGPALSCCRGGGILPATTQRIIVRLGGKTCAPGTRVPRGTAGGTGRIDRGVASRRAG